jgi:hypothetical protein
MPSISLPIVLPPVTARRSIEAVKIRPGSSRLVPSVVAIVGTPPFMKFAHISVSISRRLTFSNKS